VPEGKLCGLMVAADELIGAKLAGPTPPPQRLVEATPRRAIGEAAVIFNVGSERTSGEIGSKFTRRK
jgi:hypothetical protein